MARLDRLIVCLRLLAYGAIAFTVVEVASGVISGKPLVFSIDGAPWVGNLHDLAGRDAVFVNVFRWMSQIPWLLIVVQVERIARSASQGALLTSEIASYFKRLAQAVLAYGILECCEKPALALYLAAVGLMPKFPDIAIFDVLRVNLLLVAALFFVIARIVEVGVRLKDDADLTI